MYNTSIYLFIYLSISVLPYLYKYLCIDGWIDIKENTYIHTYIHT